MINISMASAGMQVSASACSVGGRRHRICGGMWLLMLMNHLSLKRFPIWNSDAELDILCGTWKLSQRLAVICIKLKYRLKYVADVSPPVHHLTKPHLSADDTASDGHKTIYQFNHNTTIISAKQLFPSNQNGIDIENNIYYTIDIEIVLLFQP